MGVHIEVQNKDEVMQIKSRELQLESVKKLNDITPVVESINDVDLVQIESSTSEIKDIVVNNLEDQPDLQDITNDISKMNKSISSLKGQITKLSKSIGDLSQNIEKMSKEMGDD